jgi:hypothetical protein
MLEIRVIGLIAELDGCEYVNPFYKMNGELLKPYFLDSITCQVVLNSNTHSLKPELPILP